MAEMWAFGRRGSEQKTGGEMIAGENGHTEATSS